MYKFKHWYDYADDSVDFKWDDTGSGIQLTFHANGPISGCQAFYMDGCDCKLYVAASNPFAGHNKVRVAFGNDYDLGGRGCYDVWDDMDGWGEEERFAHKLDRWDHYDNPSTISYTLEPIQCARPTPTRRRAPVPTRRRAPAPTRRRAPSPCPLPDGTVMLKNKALQTCMEGYPTNGDPTNGSPILVGQCNLWAVSMRWFVNTYDKHISMKSSSCEDMCLDVPDNDAKNGKKLQVWQCNGNAPQQKWDVESNHKVYLSGTNYCLDVGSSSPQLWTCDYASAFMDNQYWDRETMSTDVMLNATHEQQRELAEEFIV